MYESIHTRLARVPDDAISSRGTLLGRPVAEHGRHPAVELRVPAPLRAGVDGHVRVVTPAAEPARPGRHRRRGGGVAGRLAGGRDAARRGIRGTITLVGEELHLPYDRPPLSKQVLAGTWPPEKAVLADQRRSSELQRARGAGPPRRAPRHRRPRQSSSTTARCCGRRPGHGDRRRAAPAARAPRGWASATGSSRCARSTTRWRCVRR